MYKVEVEWTDANGVSQSDTRTYSTKEAAKNYLKVVCFAREDVIVSCWKETV